MTEVLLAFTLSMLTVASLLTASCLRRMGDRIDGLSEAFVTTSKTVEELMRTLAEIEKGTTRYRVETGSLSTTHRTN